MNGAPDPLYVAARTTLLDALSALEAHLDSVILVGAQAVYLHTGGGTMAVAPYTTDADLGIDPRKIAAKPLIEQLLSDAGFHRKDGEVGQWTKERVVVDLLVPASVGGPGRRGARISPHDKRAARKVTGLEGVLVDQDLKVIRSLSPDDPRGFRIAVAGPSALLVAKAHKIHDRLGKIGRQNDKDALDVLRILQEVPTDDLSVRFRALQRDERSRDSTAWALEKLAELFGTRAADGCSMAANAAAPFEPEDTIRESMVLLTTDLLEALT